MIDNPALDWGVHIDRVEIKDVALPESMKRSMSRQAESERERRSRVITADGESLGTPYYMAPEQVRSAKTADARSDIYGWAATTYHCLSGRIPLEARSYGEFIDKVFTEDPPRLDAFVPNLPASLVAMVAQCLRRAPDERYSDLADVVTQLEAIMRGLSQQG